MAVGGRAWTLCSLMFRIVHAIASVYIIRMSSHGEKRILDNKSTNLHGDTIKLPRELLRLFHPRYDVRVFIIFRHIHHHNRNLTGVKFGMLGLGV